MRAAARGSYINKKIVKPLYGVGEGRDCFKITHFIVYGADVRKCRGGIGGGAGFVTKP